MIDQSSKVRDEGNNGVTHQRLKVIVKSINRDQNSWVRVKKTKFGVSKIRVPNYLGNCCLATKNHKTVARNNN